MLILFSHRKLTPGVTAIQNTLCDLAALQTPLTSLPSLVPLTSLYPLHLCTLSLRETRGAYF